MQHREETEEEMLIRVGKLLYGENVIFPPSTLEIIKSLYHQYLEDMRKERAA